MSDVAIRVEGVSKLFRLGTSAPYYRFSETVSHAVGAPVRALHSLLHRRPTPTPKPNGHAATEPGQTASSIATERPPAPPGHFWALKDINFEVKRGEVLGIIGRNGAGKSTLLKILSRITEPTEGQITLHGRVGSLLEVGTGFHPELTGRENIFLNGAILGMTRAEIRRKFDEIVAFAEIEQFLDTPVKRYSSGMYMRLAFAVAAHLEPEILVVDEVLAVGDAEFQKKCLGKMGEVAKGGRTVLFVSHNLGAVRQICGTAVWLHNGRTMEFAPASSVVPSYLHDSSQAERTRYNRPVASRPAILSAQITSPALAKLDYGDDIELIATCAAATRLSVSLEVVIRDQHQHPVIFLPGGLRFAKTFELDPETPRNLTCRMRSLPLAEGWYSIDLILAQAGMGVLDSVMMALSFEVVRSYPDGAEMCFTQNTNQGCIHIGADFGAV
jgi:lipopolysaccharide transport system ATP-binding protein